VNDPIEIIKSIFDPATTVADVMNKDDFKCPTCEGYIPNNENIGAYMGAISRHGHGEVCSRCGTLEALEDFLKRGDRQ
jgi:succinyl-CoA synthetase alpha subunit